MAQQQTVLIADDDLRLLRLIQRNLELADYRVVTAADGLSLLRLAESASAHLYVVDVMTPGLNGREVTRRLREVSVAPVSMLTARDPEHDSVAGLRARTDDYLTKPFGAHEFLARVRALLRRASRHTPLCRLRSRGMCLSERAACTLVVCVLFGTRSGDQCLSKNRRECCGGLGAIGQQDVHQGQGARAVVLQDGLFDVGQDGLVRVFGGLPGRPRGHPRILAVLVGTITYETSNLPTKTHR